MTRWRVLVRSVPKRLEPPEHNKDRADVSRLPRGRLLAAVADGATQAYRAEEWAERLAIAWTSGALTARTRNARLEGVVVGIAKSWAEAATPPRDAPWYVGAKASRGAYSTLLGLDIHRHGRTWRWIALAVGDTELFVVGRDGQLAVAYPIYSSADFRATPSLLGTGTSNPDLGSGRRIRRTGTLRPGATMLAATDALAKCLLQAHEGASPLWNEARSSARSQRAFVEWVTGLRQSGRLEDDDTTLLVVERAR